VTRRDPFHVLGLTPDASPAAVKSAWRRLARTHHPDLAADDRAARAATRRMAEINAAYESAVRVAGERRGSHPRAHDEDRSAPHARRTADAGSAGRERPSGPPAPPVSRPVTRHVDTSSLYRARGTSTAGRAGSHLPGHQPVRAHRPGREELRASDPNGPLEVKRPRGSRPMRLPDLADARCVELVFGKFHGRTLGEVERTEPSYIDWLVRTIRRDPELVVAARSVQAELDRTGVARRGRPEREPASEAALAD
jgi:hypothetical protein